MEWPSQSKRRSYLTAIPGSGYLPQGGGVHVKRPGLFVLMSLLLACWWSSTNGQTLTPLWQFGSLSNAADGVGPNGLIQGRDGNFYGTTGGFGELNNHGTVFRITPQGNLTTLYSFGNVAGDGIDPYTTLVQGSDGNF